MSSQLSPYRLGKARDVFNTYNIFNALSWNLLVGSIISGYIPSWITTVICFIILFTIGTIKLLDSITKSIIRKYNNLNKELKFSFLNFKFILNLYANPEDADIDSSKILSIREAIALAISLSLDGLAVGFGAALTNVNGVIIFFFSFLTNTLAVLLGCNIGNKLAAKISFNLSWLSGIVLIVLAFLKLL